MTVSDMIHAGIAGMNWVLEKLLVVMVVVAIIGVVLYLFSG